VVHGPKSLARDDVFALQAHSESANIYDMLLSNDEG
jgi:hypothetical protein